MRFIMIDDDPDALENLERSVREVCPEDEINVFRVPDALLAFAEKNSFDVAFLAIEMKDVSGIALAKALQWYHPFVNIIFVTEHREYAFDAISLHPSGYMMKPVNKDAILQEMQFLRYPSAEEPPYKLKVRCFGNFEVYALNGKSIDFDRKRAKELFAYLVYRKGSACSTQEMIGILFGDEPCDKKMQSYFQTLVSSMLKTLERAGVKDVVHRTYGSLSVNTAMIDCDWYSFDPRDLLSRRLYSGEFMMQYTWAENVSGYLDLLIASEIVS